MLFFSHAIFFGYFSAFIFALFFLYQIIFPEGYQLEPIFDEESLIWYLVYFNLLMVVNRVIQRHIYTYKHYGVDPLPMIVPRYIWGAVINYFAIVRAIFIFFSHLIRGKKIGWDKTQHDFPDEEKETVNVAPVQLKESSEKIS